MSIILDIAAIIAPLFVIAGIGFIWGRSGRKFDTNMIGTLTVNFGVPCLIFSTMTTLKFSLTAFGTIAGAYTVAVIINAIMAAIVLRAMRLDVAGYLPGTVFGNNGNMGLPLCLFAFGNEGLALGISILVISTLGNFIFGIAVVSGKITPREISKTPALWVTLAALLFLLGDIETPGWLANTTKIIGGMSIPLMLITLGVSLSRLRIESAGHSLALSVLRLGLGFGIGLAVASLFGLEGAARGVLILQCAMPAAVINYIIAIRFNRCASEIAGLVVISTLISFATLPLLLYVVIP